MYSVKVIKTEDGKPKELWYSIQIDSKEDFSKQLASLEKEEAVVLKKYSFKRKDIVAKRFFCSDIVNQYPLLKKRKNACKTDFAFFCLGQPPANGSKISMHGLCIKGILKKSRDENSFKFQTSSGLLHIMNEHMYDEKSKTTEKQTQNIFIKLKKTLRENHSLISKNTFRTWIYQPNLDADYMDMARQRKIFFDKNLLKKTTHYIASTGIQGESYISHARVFMDAYSILGVQEEQVKYISVPKYMPQTHTYGITFERATKLTFQNKNLLLISGTASIDRYGNVMYLNNVLKQVRRIIINIKALLKEAKLNIHDLVNLTVYLRDVTDYKIVKNFLDIEFNNIPIIYVKAAVCRPAWLVEIEGIASNYIADK